MKLKFHFINSKTKLCFIQQRIYQRRLLAKLAIVVDKMKLKLHFINYKSILNKGVVIILVEKQHPNKIFTLIIFK